MDIEIPKDLHFGKIVATIGPASESRKGITALSEAGADVFRTNFSHGSHKEHKQRITHARDIEKEIGKPISIIADLQGPKLRIGTFADDEEDEGVTIKSGASFSFHLKKIPGDEQKISLMHPEIFKVAKKGMEILIDDGRLRFHVDTVNDGVLETTVVTGGKMKQKKGVNIPTVQLPVSAITEKDKKDLIFALSQGIDWIALSFVQKPEDIQRAREMIGDKAGIIAKIEKPSAVEYIEDIIKEADVIMVARGDLGVEIPPEEVPNVQKRIITLCRKAGKPVIVATHMLDSMVGSPHPTRAEVSDVANAIYDGSDAVMLSAETAAGDYPNESVKMMRQIARHTINDSEFFTAEHKIDFTEFDCVTDTAVTDAQKEIQNKKYAAVIAHIPSIESGMCYARRRYKCPLIAVTTDQNLARQLALVWGVFPIYTKDAVTEDALAALAQSISAPDKEVGIITLTQ